MTTNQQRAALALAEIEQYGDVRQRQHILAAALDAAEARGRAEVVAKVRELATEWLRDGTAPTQAFHLRTLAAEASA